MTKLKNILQKKSTKDIFWMIGSNIAIKPLQVVKSFFVAKHLGPEHYGILKSVELIQMLNKFGNLGFNSTVIRNVGTKINQNNKEQIQNIKNTAYSSELVLSFLLFVAGLISNFFFQSLIIRYAIILSSIGLFTLKVQGIFNTEAIINKRFKLLSKITFIQGLINSVFIIATIPFLKIYAVLAIPVFSTLLIIYVFTRKLKIPFKFKFDKTLFKDICKTSLKFTMGTLAFGAFRYTERIIIISMIGLEAVGYFGFADTILALFVTIFLTNIKVRKMNILEYLGNKEFSKVHQIVIRETTFLTFISIMVVIFSMISLNIFIPIFLDKWIEGIFVTQIFLLILPFKVINSYVITVVKSPIVNKLLYSVTLHSIGIFTLLVGSYILKQLNLLSLINFIYLDVFVYAFVHISWLFIYYKDYYKPYVKNSIN